MACKYIYNNNLYTKEELQAVLAAPQPTETVVPIESPNLNTQRNILKNKAALRIFEDSSTYNLESLEILLNATNDQYFKRLLEVLKISEVEFTINNNLTWKDSPVYGLYNTLTKEIQINPRLHVEDNPLNRPILDTLLHELIHKHLESRLKQSPRASEAFSRLEEIYKIVKNLYKGNQEYSTSSLSEFVAEVMSNRTFQEELAAIPFKNTNIFFQFIENVIHFLGISKGTLLFESMYRILDTYQIVASEENVAISSGLTSRIQYSTYIIEDLAKESKSLVRDNVTNQYTHKSTQDTFDSVTNFLPNFQTRPLRTGFDVAFNAADKLWKNLPHETKQKIKEFPGKDLNYDEYAALKKERHDRFVARAEIYHLKFHLEISKDPAAATEMKSLMDAYAISDGEIEWLSEIDDDGISTIRRILENRTGTDYWRENPQDKIVTEIAVASSLLGLAGRIDLAIDHGDNIMSLYDIKTGNGIASEWENYLFKYGDTYGRAIWDNPLNRAKLQLMLYALILKSTRPEVRFRQLKVLHIPSEYDKHRDGLQNNVDVVAYLQLLENFFKNDPSVAGKYEALIKQNPDLFKAEHYMATTYESAGVSRTGDPAMELRLKIQELQELVLYDKNIVNKVLKGEAGSWERTKRIEELMSQIIEMKKDKTMSLASWDTDMGWLDTWLGSASYSTNPYVQLYYSMLTSAKQKVRNDYEPWRAKFTKLLEDVAKEAGINPRPMTKLIGGVNLDAITDKFIKTEKIGEGIFERYITKETDPVEWAALTPKQQELLFFVLESNDQFFVDEKSTWVDPKTGKKKALANKVVTYRKTKSGKVGITALDLHNGGVKTPGQRQSGTATVWYRGFMPKIAPKLEDVVRRHTWLSPEVRTHLANKYFTTFYESSFDQWNNTAEAIPLKGLGSKEIDESGNYSRSFEYVIDTFVKQNFYKQHLDEVYTFGLALQIYLKMQEATADKELFKNTIGWFEDTLELHILGKKDYRNDWVGRKLKINSKGGYKQFNFTKFLYSLKGFFAGPTMWLKPLTGLPNGIFAYLVTLKEAAKNSFFISGPHANFGLNEVREASGVAFGMQIDGMLGNLRDNKAYLLMEKFGYLPDNYDWYTQSNELLTSRNKLFTTKSMLFFHSMPEEYVATVTFVAQLKAMTFVNEQGQLTNMWDAYTLEDVQDETGTHKEIVWKGGVRGKRNINPITGAPPEYEEVTGLTIEELNAVKFLYEKLHGGYRLDERVRLEYYVGGTLILQFKKYLPSVFKNIGASRGIRYTQGFLAEEIDEQGHKVLKWTPQVVEGRWRLLAGLMLNYIGMRHQAQEEGTKGSKVMEWFGYQKNHSYKWSELSATQKEDLIDFGTTFLALAILFAGFSFAWDRDEEDTFAKIYKRIMNDLTVTANPMEIGRNIESLFKPVAFGKTRKLAESTIDVTLSMFLLSAGYDDQALTQQGNLRGWKEMQRNVHFLSAWHDFYKGVSENETMSELFEQRSK